jgi:hypothetical protein
MEAKTAGLMAVSRRGYPAFPMAQPQPGTSAATSADGRRSTGRE